MVRGLCPWFEVQRGLNIIYMYVGSNLVTVPFCQMYKYILYMQLHVHVVL